MIDNGSMSDEEVEEMPEPSVTLINENSEVTQLNYITGDPFRQHGRTSKPSNWGMVAARCHSVPPTLSWVV